MPFYDPDLTTSDTNKVFEISYTKNRMEQRSHVLEGNIRLGGGAASGPPGVVIDGYEAFLGGGRALLGLSFTLQDHLQDMIALLGPQSHLRVYPGPSLSKDAGYICVMEGGSLVITSL